jgi:hypothetical protein
MHRHCRNRHRDFGLLAMGVAVCEGVLFATLSELDQRLAMVQLYKALGGGWTEAR